jgi:hypothetical protein
LTCQDPSYDQALGDLRSEDYLGFVAWVDRRERWNALFALEWFISPAKFHELLADVWNDAEGFPPEEDLEYLIDTMMPGDAPRAFGEDVAFFEALPKSFTAYRGARSGVNEAGRSWTLSKDRAIWFAGRFEHLPGEPILQTRVISKGSVMFYLDAAGRNEQEVVLWRPTASRRQRVLRQREIIAARERLAKPTNGDLKLMAGATA